jgi:hypothetical protein
MRPLRLLIVMLVVVLVAACGPSRDTKLSAVPVREKSKQEARAATAGVFSASESDCILDKLFARSDLDVGQISDFAKKPQTSGPVAEAYKEIVPQCIDPNAVVPPSAMSPELRKGFTAGVKSSLPTATDEQVSCLIDSLLATGLTPRDFTLAGYIPSYQQKVIGQIGDAGKKCGLSR